MKQKRLNGPFIGKAGSGMDRDFPARDEAEREIERTMAGPKSDYPSVASDDTALKNPDDEFAEPGSSAELHKRCSSGSGSAPNDGARHSVDVQAQQSGTTPAERSSK